MNQYLQEKLDREMWDEICAGMLWSPEFIIELHDEQQTLKDCPIDFLRQAELYKDYYLRNDLLRINPADLSLYISDISSCDTPRNAKEEKYRAGYLNSHIVETGIKGVPIFVELPEVQVKKDDTPYLTYLDGVSRLGCDYRKALLRSLAYCHRLNVPVVGLYNHARKRGYKDSELNRMIQGVSRIADRLKTMDYWLADWAEKALTMCNTVGQTHVIRWIYIQAATYDTKQPRICKKTIAIELGMQRTTVVRLFKRLEKAGMLVQREETYSYDHKLGAPRSNARIVNLDPTEPNRWESYSYEPTITKHRKSAAYIEDISSCDTPETTVTVSQDELREYSGEWRRTKSKLPLEDFVREKKEIDKRYNW